MFKAAPVVEPTIEISKTVPDPVIEVFEVVKACVAAAAMLTPVKVTETTRPFAATVPDAAPLATVGVSKRPVPAVEATRFPFVAVMLPSVAVMEVPAVIVVPEERAVPAAIVVVEAIEPGAMNVAGMESVATPAAVVTVIWLVVPRIEMIFPAEEVSSTQFADVTPVDPAVLNDIRYHKLLPTNNHSLPRGKAPPFPRISVEAGALFA
jgi:hypothetical protein